MGQQGTGLYSGSPPFCCLGSDGDQMESPPHLATGRQTPGSPFFYPPSGFLVTKPLHRLEIDAICRSDCFPRGDEEQTRFDSCPSSVV
jgi:hypothetical protein